MTMKITTEALKSRKEFFSINSVPSVMEPALSVVEGR